MHILLGLIIMAVGVSIIMKTEWMLRNFGTIAVFDKYLGAEGGTRLGYKMIGLLFFFIGLLIMTDMIGGFLMWLLSPLIKFM